MVVTYWIDLLFIWLCLICTAYSNITSFGLVYDVDLVTVLCVLDDMDALIRYIRSVAIGLSWLIYITYSLLVTVKHKWCHLYSVSQGEMLLYVACTYWSRSVPWSEVFTVKRKTPSDVWPMMIRLQVSECGAVCVSHVYLLLFSVLLHCKLTVSSVLSDKQDICLCYLLFELILTDGGRHRSKLNCFTNDELIFKEKKYQTLSCSSFLIMRNCCLCLFFSGKKNLFRFWNDWQINKKTLNPLEIISLFYDFLIKNDCYLSSLAELAFLHGRTSFWKPVKRKWSCQIQSILSFS